jgi:hypothetical protein
MRFDSNVSAQKYSAVGQKQHGKEPRCDAGRSLVGG